MKTLFWGGWIFGSCFFAHWALWKVHLPRRQVKALLIILSAGAAAEIAALILAPSPFQWLGVAAPQGMGEVFSVALFVVALILSYMITYTALEADSPSLVIVNILHEAASKGIDAGGLESFLNDERLIVPRLNDLELDGMIRLEGKKYCLTAKGRFLARLFIGHRKILGLDKGG